MVRTISYILGAVMALAGIIALAMGGSVLGTFTAGTTLSVSWLVAGIITLVVAIWMPAQSMLWAKIIGVILAIVAVVGFVMSGPVLGLLDNTMANNVLHIVLAIIFLIIGFVPMGRSMEAPAQPAM